MLSQRVIKAYVQVGTEVVSDQSRRILADSVDRFSRQLKQLRTIINEPEQQAVLAEIEHLCPEAQGIAPMAVAREYAPALQERAKELQTLPHQLAGLIENDSHISVGRQVTAAGRQRVLPQRVAKAYMLRAWDIAPLRSEKNWIP